MKKKIYILGNPITNNDNLPLKIMDKLRIKFPEIEFVHLDPTEGSDISGELVLIDTVAGINKVEIFSGLSVFEKSFRNSVHDYDLPVFLGLMLKLKKIKSVKIICIPQKYSVAEAISEVSKIIFKNFYNE